MLRCGISLIALLAALISTSAMQDKIDGKLLLGKWEPETKPQGAKLVIEFAKEGKLTVDAEFGGQKINMDGSYKLEGDQLTITMKQQGKEETTKMKVTKLNDKEMVTKDDKDKMETLKRVASK
ncbi:MAG: TIGR03066 family protein [Planctomycetia bacterium]|nr:TIGR03066 family protein [Planctomycetia bacterium]